MNAKARLLGMNDSHFADPTGLSPTDPVPATWCALGKAPMSTSSFANIR